MSALTARTRVFTILGNPVEHSLSPVIQNAAFQEAGVDGVYVALRCDAERMVGFMSGVGWGGGAGKRPHFRIRRRPLPSSTDRRRRVRRTGACNTFWGEDGELCGDNTDVEGFRRALRHFLGGAPTGYRVLLLGGGGAARAALLSLIDDQAQDVLILNRTVKRGSSSGAQNRWGSRTRGGRLFRCR